MKEDKNPHVLLSINLPFAQADIDYCSKGQTFLLYCQINAHQGVQVFRFPSNNHFEHTEENVQHIEHTHTPDLMASCQYQQVQKHSFYSDAQHISKQQGLHISIAC